MTIHYYHHHYSQHRYSHCHRLSPKMGLFRLGKIHNLIINIFVIFNLIPLSSQKIRRNGFETVRVTIGAIFGEGEENSAVYAAYKLATLNMKSYTNDYSYNFKTVFVEDVSDSFQLSGAICQILVDGAVLIIGPVHQRTMNTIRSLTNHYDILYLTISDPHLYAGETENSMKAERVIKLKPTTADVLADFIYEQQWSRILFIYDSDEALYRLRMLFEITNANNYELSTDARMFPAHKKSNLLAYINNQSRSFSKKQIVLDLANMDSKKLIFAQLKETIINRFDYHYVFLTADYKELSHSFLKNGGLNFTAFSLIDYSNPLVEDFLQNKWKNNLYNSHINESILFPELLSFTDILQTDAALIIDGINIIKKAIQSAGLPNEPIKSKSDEPCTPETVPKWTARNLLPIFHKMTYHGLTGQVGFNSTGFREHFSLTIQESRIKQNLLKVGNWTQGKGITRIEKTEEVINTHHRRVNVTVTSIVVAPFLEKVEINGVISYQGFCVDLIDAIAHEVNFSYVIKEVEDGSYGAIVNDSWNGMIGELIRHTADLAVAPLTITSSRERVVDFSTPFMEFGLSVIYIKGNKKDLEMFAFMKPLSTDIWMCIAYAYLGVSVVLFMVSRLNPQDWNDNANITNTKLNPDPGATEFSIFNSFWFSLSAFMQQGGDVSPKSLSGRIVGGVWWFFTLIIVSSYTANLAAYLTVERMSTPIKSYEDLAKQNKIKYGVVDSGSSKEFFSKSRIEVFKKMWQFMEANQDVFVKNITSGYKKVIHSKGEYAFILESTMNDYFNTQEPCITTKIGPNLDSGKGYGIATPPGSDLRDDINLAVLKLKEKNQIPQLYQKWWENRTKCSLPEEFTQNSISKNSVKLEQIKGLFVLLLCALAFGIFLSILELVYKCALESKRKKKSFFDAFKTLSEKPKKPNQCSYHSETERKSVTESRVMFAI